MAYNKHVWTDGEIIDASKLNNLEDGVYNAYGADVTAARVRDINNAASEEITKLNNAFAVDGGLVGNSYNLFGREYLSYSPYNNPAVTNVSNGYKVVYNTALSSGACYYRVRFISDITPYIDKKLTFAFDGVPGTNNTAGANCRVALYNGNKLLKSYTFNTNGHFSATTGTIADGSTGSVELYIYPDVSNSNRTHPNAVTVTNIMVNEGDIALDYMPPKTAIDYVARSDNTVINVPIATNANISNRTGGKVIDAEHLNTAVKAALTDINAMVLDDDAKAKACETLGVYRKPTDGWVLKGTITTATKADGATLDLTGCTEVCILCASISMSTTINVMANGVALFYKSSSGSAKKYVVNLRDTISGYSVDGKYSTDLNANPGNTVDGYDRIDGSHVASITSITFANPAGIDACDVKIYAR